VGIKEGRRVWRNKNNKEIDRRINKVKNKRKDKSIKDKSIKDKRIKRYIDVHGVE